MLRERKTIPLTRPILRTMRQPGSSTAVVTSFGLMALMAPMVLRKRLCDEKTNQVANARERLERVDALDHLLTARSAENGRHETSRLCGDCRRVERILLGAGRKSREVRDRAPIALADLHVRAPRRRRIHQRSIADQLARCFTASTC